jgi:hypothetical protein
MKFMLNNSRLNILLVALLIIAAGIISLPVTLSTFAQTSSGGMKKTTNGGALDVLLQPSPQPIANKGQTSFKVTFLQKGTDKVEAHIDYDFVIMNGKKQVFEASQLAGQPGKPLHTAEGIVTIPYTFQSPGDYSVNIMVYGILFNPIRPESAEYSLKVTP